MLASKRSQAARQSVIALACACLLAFATACAQTPGEPDCPGFSWDRSPCETDSFYVVYADVLPYRETMRQLAAGQNPDIGATIKEFCTDGAGIGLWEEYEGDAKPEPLYYALEVLVADSGAAEAVQRLLGDAEIEKDSEGYYDYNWIVTVTRPLSTDDADSATAELDASGIDVEDIWTADDNALLFFGTCLSREAAEALRDELLERDVPVDVMQLEYQELDI